jgi:hypothetical protein
LEAAGNLVPELIYPVGNFVVADTTSTMMIWFVNGINSIPLTYDIELQDVEVFSGTPTVSGIVDLPYTYTDLLPGTTYYYKVRAFNGTEYSAWSSTGIFTTATSEQFRPIAGSPVKNVPVYTNAPTLSWFTPGIATPGMKYDVEYSSSSNFSNATILTGLSSKSVKVSGMQNGQSYYWRVRSKNTDGTYSAYSTPGSFHVEGVTDVRGTAGVVPKEFVLEQNYPNPFNPSTMIRFSIPEESKVTLKVFNMLGQEVVALLNGQQMNAGSYAVNFDASSLANGMYLYRIDTERHSAVKKMLLIK